MWLIKFKQYNIMAKKEFSFNEAVVEIEKILMIIESGELDVDKLALEVKRASELIKQCQKKLRTTEEEINSIFKDLHKINQDRSPDLLPP